MAGLVASLIAPSALAQDKAPAVAPQPAAAATPNDEPKPAVDLPDAKTVLNKYVDALGGAHALMSHTSRHATGMLETIARSEVVQFEIFAAAPNKMLMKLILPGDRKREGGCNGEITWAWDSGVGPQVFGPPNPDSAPNFDFYKEMHYADYYPEMQTIGLGPFDGRDCYKVRLVSKSGSELFEYFDAKTGLKAGEETMVRGPSGAPMRSAEVWADWRDIDGVKVSMRRTTMRQGGDPKLQGQVHSIMTFDNVEFDHVDPQVFDLPPEVKQVADAQQNAPPAPADNDGAKAPGDGGHAPQ